jgi:hypothetical protein
MGVLWGKFRRSSQQRQHILHRVRLDVGVAQRGFGAAMPEPVLDLQQWIAHQEPPGREGMPEAVEGELGVNGGEEAADDLGEGVGVEAPAAVGGGG